MKKYLILILAMLVTIGCKSKQPNNKYTISGNATELTVGDTLRLELTDNKTEGNINTAVVGENGAYEFKGTVEEVVMAQILTSSNESVGTLYLEPGDIKSEIFHEMTLFKGSPLNDSYSETAKQLMKIQEEYASLDENDKLLATKQQELFDSYESAIRSTVEHNLDNILGVNMFAYSLINSLESGQEVLDIINSFSEEMQQKEVMVELRTYAQQMLKSDVGGAYTDITLNDTNDQSIALSSLIAPGKYVLLDFWATWCGPCMGEMPHLKEAYAEYHSKGFEIYGVSLDQNRDAWVKFATTLPWVNVLQQSDSQPSEDYAVNSIPSNFLIGPDGTIIAKNLRGSMLIEKLSEIIK